MECIEQSIETERDRLATCRLPSFPDAPSQPDPPQAFNLARTPFVPIRLSRTSLGSHDLLLRARPVPQRPPHLLQPLPHAPLRLDHGRTLRIRRLRLRAVREGMALVHTGGDEAGRLEGSGFLGSARDRLAVRSFDARSSGLPPPLHHDVDGPPRVRSGHEQVIELDRRADLCVVPPVGQTGRKSFLRGRLDRVVRPAGHLQLWWDHARYA